jgi:hypothetical protein
MSKYCQSTAILRQLLKQADAMRFQQLSLLPVIQYPLSVTAHTKNGRLLAS